MKSCSPALCVLILLTITVTTGSVSALSTVMVKLHGSATLSCSERCSGLVRWTVFHKSTDTLAECNQTSCRSVKEGYQMIHDQYLNGNFSLTITDVDFSKRSSYTCDCDGEDLCDVQLQVEPVNTPVQIKPGDSLVLKIETSEEVEVIYNSTDPAGPSGDQICTSNRRSLQCKPEYTQRASLTSDLTLRGMKISDSGVYTVRDKLTEEVTYIYTVTVETTQRNKLHDDQTDPEVAVPEWGIVLIVMGAVTVAVTVGLVVVIVKQRREIQRYRRERNKVEMRKLMNSSEEAEKLSPPSENQEL